MSQLPGAHCNDDDTELDADDTSLDAADDELEALVDVASAGKITSPPHPASANAIPVVANRSKESVRIKILPHSHADDTHTAYSTRFGCRMTGEQLALVSDSGPVCGARLTQRRLQLGRR
jgi:hypothetical protein